MNNYIGKSMNNAQKLLIKIGGTAVLVAGQDGHYWADNQTAKSRRHGIPKAHYGDTLQSHFDLARQVAKRAAK